MRQQLHWLLKIGLLGLCSSFGLVFAVMISESLPSSPVAQSMKLVSSAYGEPNHPSIPDGLAGATFQASHWFESTALPALVGVSIGLLAGWLWELRLWDAIGSGAVFLFVSLQVTGSAWPPDLAGWLGIILFPFCLLGGNSAVYSLAPRRRDQRGGTEVLR